MKLPGDLRIGNLVDALHKSSVSGEFGKGYVHIRTFDKANINILIDAPYLDEYVSCQAEYADINPIPLNRFWRERLVVTKAIPSWITAVHELQNWHYWNHRKELPLDKLPFTEGDNLCMKTLLFQETKYTELQRQPKLAFPNYTY